MTHMFSSYARAMLGIKKKSTNFATTRHIASCEWWKYGPTILPPLFTTSLLGMAMGRVGLKDGVFTPSPHGFVLPHPRHAPPPQF